MPGDVGFSRLGLAWVGLFAALGSVMYVRAAIVLIEAARTMAPPF